jgi:hypothetical protein
MVHLSHFSNSWAWTRDRRSHQYPGLMIAIWLWPHGANTEFTGERRTVTLLSLFHHFDISHGQFMAFQYTAVRDAAK